MSLLDESVEAVTLTEDTASERAHLPSPEELRGDLLLADRGYFDKEYLADVDRAGGSFVVRASASINPVVRRAYTCRGEELEELSGRRLKECALSKDEMVDLDVVWGKGPQAFRARVVARWNPQEGHYMWLVTNLTRDRYTAQAVGQLYRLRWQVELMFKEWKSYANLHAFDTNNAGIAEGLIWTAIAASILKRYLGQMTQALRGVEISTRKAAMCARHGLGGLFRVLATGVYVPFVRFHDLALARRSQKSSKRLLSTAHLRAMMALAPATVQRIPPRLRRVPTMCLQPPSTTPVATHRPMARNFG